jgi:hypothetical protein
MFSVFDNEVVISLVQLSDGVVNLRKRSKRSELLYQTGELFVNVDYHNGHQCYCSHRKTEKV